MVEINNQRKAFLDMLAWSEGTDNGRQKTRNHGYDVIVGGELILSLNRSLRRIATKSPKAVEVAVSHGQLRDCLLKRRVGSRCVFSALANCKTVSAIR